MKKLMKKIKMNNKGFTLVELIVVIAVLAIITVVAAPQYLKYVEKSKVGTDENALGEIAHIAEIEWVEYKATTENPTDTSILVNTTGGKFTVTKATNGGDLDSLVSDLVGDYTIKSDTYKKITSGVTININPTTGAAYWTDAEGVQQGGGSAPTN